MAIAQKHPTLEEFLRLPEDKPALEYFDGGISQKMSPRGRHSALQGALIEHINRVVLPTKVAMAFPELRATFAGASRVPDVSVYRWNRVPRDSRGDVADDFLIPPDIAIEIASPQQSVNALVRRCRWFVSHGVEMALLVDPEDRSVLRFLADSRVDEWQGADRIELGGAVPGLQLTVEALFSSLAG